MTSLSDTLTLGLVLVLLFGSIALYLYTRIQQAEQKISLLESILLDLKMSSEIKSYNELPAAPVVIESTEHTKSEYIPFEDSGIHSDDNTISEYQTLDEGLTLLEDNDNKNNNETKLSPAPSVSSNLDDLEDIEVKEYKAAISNGVMENTLSKNVNTSLSINYESMTIKELQNLAKSRGITGAGSMKKGSIIEALKTSDRSHTIESGSFESSSNHESSIPSN
jgi:hypothetical protein